MAIPLGRDRYFASSMIERIHIAKEHGGPVGSVPEARIVAGKGIEGDRNFGESRWVGQNLTLIEAEAVEEIAANFGVELDPCATRRNLVVRGVRLDELVGTMFSIGEVVLRGVELCEPCTTLADHLGWDAKKTLDVFRHRGGLRCDCLVGGVVREGMAFAIPVEADPAGN